MHPRRRSRAEFGLVFFFLAGGGGGGVYLAKVPCNIDCFHVLLEPFSHVAPRNYSFFLRQLH